MNYKDKIVSELSNKNYIHFSDEEFAKIDLNTLKSTLKEFGSQHLLRMPEWEIKFFEWLKDTEYAVWNDLWGEDSDEMRYIVSLDLLPLFTKEDWRGFPICDLRTTDNYFFTIENMVDEESRLMIEAVQELFHNKKPLTTAQLLALEISLDPLDIWHFAYHYKILLSEAKKAVASLVTDNVLVHLREAEYVAPFIHF